MGKPVTHQVRRYQTTRFGVSVQVVTTLCGRVRHMGDGMNIAGHSEAVTCKLCLRRAALAAIKGEG